MVSNGSNKSDAIVGSLGSTISRGAVKWKGEVDTTGDSAVPPCENEEEAAAAVLS